jgi:hypothetical protein
MSKPKSETETPEPEPRVRSFPLPPADAKIPQPDPGWKPPTDRYARGIAPRTPELVLIAQAIGELRRFEPKFAATFGRGAPSFENTMDALEAAEAWSRMRTMMKKWDKVCAANESASWTLARRIMGKLSPSLTAATVADPSLGQELMCMDQFLGVMKVIGKRGAATRKRNRELKAQGLPERAGAIGKRRLRADLRRAYAESIAKQGQDEG